MASQHYGPAMYSSQGTHGPNVFEPVVANQHPVVGDDGAGAYPPRREAATAQAPTTHAYTYHEGPAAKRRRTEETPAGLKFVSQKKWAFPESQPWMEVHPSTSSKVKSLAKMAGIHDTAPHPQQLPTPQTPRFPPPSVSHTDTGTVFAKEQASTGLYGKPTPSRSIALGRAHGHTMSESSSAAFQPESAATIEQRPVHSQRISSSPQKSHRTAQHDADPASLIVAASSSKTRPASPSPNPKVKTPHRTLSLEKDRDRITALIAAKRKENEASLFRQRLLQKQIDHQKQVSSKPGDLVTPTNPSTSGAVPAMAAQLSTLGSEALASQSPVPAQPSSHGLSKPSHYSNQHQAAPESPATYALPTVLHSIAPTGRDGSESAMKDVTRKAKTKSNVTSTFPSPAPTYSTTFTATPRDSEPQGVSPVPRRSSNTRLDQQSDSPGSEIRQPSRAGGKAYASKDNSLPHSVTGEEIVHGVRKSNTALTLTPTWKPTMGGGGTPLPKEDPRAAWSTSRDYRYMSSGVPSINAHVGSNSDSQSRSRIIPNGTLPSVSSSVTSPSSSVPPAAAQSRPGQMDSSFRRTAKYSPLLLQSSTGHRQAASQAPSAYYPVNQNYYFPPVTPPGALVSWNNSSSLEALAHTAATSTPVDVAGRSQAGKRETGESQAPNNGPVIFNNAGTAGKGEWTEVFKHGQWMFYPPAMSGAQ